MKEFHDFDLDLWHIDLAKLDLCQREQVRIGEKFGLTDKELKVVEYRAVELANIYSEIDTKIFNNITDYICMQKLRALTSEIFTLKNLEPFDFHCEVSEDGVRVFYKGEKQ